MTDPQSAASVPPRAGARSLLIKLAVSLLVAGFFVFLLRQGALELWPGEKAFAAVCLRPRWIAVDMWTAGRRALRGEPAGPSRAGAGDRIRTGDVQLGKLAFCH